MSFRENEQFLINRICVHILLLVVFFSTCDERW